MSPTGIINLKACKNYKNKFEQGMINEFTVEAVDLGDLVKVRIGHDNSGGERTYCPKTNKAVIYISTALYKKNKLFFLNQGVHLVGSWTGSTLMPLHRVRGCASHVAVGWIKGRMMVQL